MHIGMDLDGTLVNWINRPEKIAAFRLKVEEPKRFNYHYVGVPVKLRAEIFSLFKDFEFMSMNNLTYDPWDKIVLMKWKKSGHILTVITSRNKNSEMKRETERIVGEWFPEIDKLIIVKHGKDKIEYFKSLKLNIWIDDHPDIASEAQCLGIKTYLIDKPYNKDPFWKKLQRVRSIYQLYEMGIIKC